RAHLQRRCLRQTTDLLCQGSFLSDDQLLVLLQGREHRDVPGKTSVRDVPAISRQLFHLVVSGSSVGRAFPRQDRQWCKLPQQSFQRRVLPALLRWTNIWDWAAQSFDRAPDD